MKNKSKYSGEAELRTTCNKQKSRYIKKKTFKNVKNKMYLFM